MSTHPRRTRWDDFDLNVISHAFTSSAVAAAARARASRKRPRASIARPPRASSLASTAPGVDRARGARTHVARDV